MSITLGLFFFPLLCFIVLFLFPKQSKFLKETAFILSLVPIGLLVYGSFSSTPSFTYPWIPVLSIHFDLAVDRLSVIFLYLTVGLIPIAILAANPQETYSRKFYGLIFLLESLLIGFFIAQDLVLFMIFWEAMLIPVFIMIARQGNSKKQRISLTFLIYMLAGSVFMIAAILALYFSAGEPTFNIQKMQAIAQMSPHAPYILLAFLLAFLVKVPSFPFHSWLPDTYYEASTSVTILLSALLSKAGLYGIIRICLGLFPALIENYTPLLTALAFVGTFYGAFAAFAQKDIKRVIIYSSFSHVNFLLIGIFSLVKVGYDGALLQIINHSLTITALFLIVGWLEMHSKTLSLEKLGGLAARVPHLAWVSLFFVLASIGLPGTNNFVGEVLILFGLFIQHPIVAALLALMVVASAIYMLRWMQRIYFGIQTKSEGKAEERQAMEESKDLRFKQALLLLPLVVLTLWIGLYPGPLLKYIELTAEEVVFLSNSPSKNE